MKTEMLNLILPELEDLPISVQQITVGGSKSYTLPTASTGPFYPNSDNWSDYFPPSDTGSWGDGGFNPGGTPGDGHPDLVCTCASELISDAGDGGLSQETTQKITSAANAVGLGNGVQGLTWGSLDAFADALNLADAGGKVVSAMSGASGVIGVVSGGASMILAVRQDGFDWSNDWDEVVGLAAGAIGAAGLVVTLPVSLTVGAAVIGVAAGIAGYYNGQPLEAPSSPVDSSCPVHG